MPSVFHHPRPNAAITHVELSSDMCAGIDSALPVSVAATLGARLAALAANDSVTDPRAWREPFVHLSEILSVPGRFSATCRIGTARGRNGDVRLHSDLVITCFGSATEDVEEELLQVAEQVVAHVGGTDRPFWLDFIPVAEMGWPTDARAAVLVRQQAAEVMLEDRVVEVPLRFTNPGPGAAARLLQTMLAYGAGLDIFMSVTPTQLRPDEDRRLADLSKATAESMVGSVPSMRRAAATAVDLGASMRTQTFTLQLLVASQRPMGDAVRQAIGASFTAAYDTERFRSARVVARPDRFIGGGFEIEPVRDPSRWLTALSQGVPVLGAGRERALCDLISSTELEYVFGWIGDQLGQLPGMAMTNARARVVTDGPTAIRIGIDPFDQPIRIAGQDRHLHTVVLGGTGSGKTTFVADCAAQDIAAGRAVVAIDPHGDLLYRIAARIPAWRRRDTFILDGSDGPFDSIQYLKTYPEDSSKQDLVEEGIIEGMISDLNPNFSGPVFMRTMRNALRAVRICRKRISDIPEIFQKGFDPHEEGYMELDRELTFFFQEIAAWSDNYRAEMLTYATSKFSSLQIGAVRDTFDAEQGASLVELLAGRPIILVRPGDSGGSAQQVMGMFLGAMLACLRHRTTSDETIAAFLDEAQLYSGAMLRRTMNESRKRALAVHAATQSMTNLGSHFEAFAGNAGTMVIGRCSTGTAGFASSMLDTPVRVLERLPNLTFLVRPTVDGTPMSAVSCRIDAPTDLPTSWPDWVWSRGTDLPQ